MQLALPSSPLSPPITGDISAGGGCSSRGKTIGIPRTLVRLCHTCPLFPGVAWRRHRRPVAKNSLGKGGRVLLLLFLLLLSPLLARTIAKGFDERRDWLTEAKNVAFKAQIREFAEIESPRVFFLSFTLTLSLSLSLLHLGALALPCVCHLCVRGVG